MAMCGAEGTRRPRWRTSTPLSKRGAASSRPDTSWEEADASRVTAPPASDPVPRTVNGTAPRPPSSMTAPSSRSAARMGATGRCEARASPRNSTWRRSAPPPAGTKRITVPALPTSTRVPRRRAGRVPPARSRARRRRRCVAPSAVSARAISSVSLACSGRVMTPGPSASAARTSARLVMDFEPGSVSSPAPGRPRPEPARPALPGRAAGASACCEPRPSTWISSAVRPGPPRARRGAGPAGRGLRAIDSGRPGHRSGGRGLARTDRGYEKPILCVLLTSLHVTTG